MSKDEETIKLYYVNKTITLIKKINSIDTSKKIDLAYVLSLLMIGSVEYVMQNYSYFRMLYMDIANKFTGIYDEELDKVRIL